MKKNLAAIFSTALLLPGIALAERILVVGDSITGQSMILPYGYTNQVRKALQENGVANVEFIPLGGSGQSVTSWQKVVKNSAEKNQQLDIKGILVKEEFDKGADTLIILLGMNDALAPYTDIPALERWKDEYQKLIDMLKARTKFSKLILASPTMLTETPYSYKNNLMDELAKAIREVAKKNNAEYLDTREQFKKFHDNARKQNPKILFTLDYVHPNSHGHTSLTYSMLNAIGQKSTAEKYHNEKINPIMKDFSKPGISLYVQNSKTEGEFSVRENLRGEELKNLKVQLPVGLTLGKISGTANDFTFTVKGNLNQLQNTIAVSAGNVKQTLKLNAPFLICTGLETPRWFKPTDFDKAKADTQIDIDAKAGKDVTKTAVKGKVPEWLVYFPTLDVTGGNDPDAIDFASVTNGKAFESGYAFRSVYSPDDRKVNLSVGTRIFSGLEQVTVYLNGNEVYSDVVTTKKGRKDAVPVELKKGKNTLVIRVCHVTKQWAASVGFKNADGTEIPNLTYSLER